LGDRLEPVGPAAGELSRIPSHGVRVAAACQAHPDQLVGGLAHDGRPSRGPERGLASRGRELARAAIADAQGVARYPGPTSRERAMFPARMSTCPGLAGWPRSPRPARPG